MQCAVHKKEMRFNAKYGYSCPTPIKKSQDGKTVIEWCSWKPPVEPGEDVPFTDNEPQTEGRLGVGTEPGNDESGPNWVEIGRVKALCGMVNARLQNHTPAEILVEVPHLRQLLRHLEGEARKE